MTQQDVREVSGTAPSRVLVVVLPDVHALDFAGPVQTVYEANGFGAGYDLRFVSEFDEVRTAQGFSIGRLQPLPEPAASDWIVVAGTDSATVDDISVPVDWLRRAAQKGARLSSVCSGAIALGRAGLLDGKQCTTHWKMLDRLRDACNKAEVLDNRLYVCDGNIVTSAGEASGIDMALYLVEQDHGPKLAARVAREMVVYVRRAGEATQRSIYLEHREHIHPSVHRVQDWIMSHPDRRATIDELARVAALSPRHLTRVFRESTGVTLKAFAHKVKLEVAKQLTQNPTLTIEDIATRCGFSDARQLRRIWKQQFGTTMREARRPAGRRATV